MSKVAAGRRMVEELVASGVMSQEDLAYCVLSVDPYNDTVWKCNGMPDAQMADQITVQAPDQITIGAPIGQVGNWSFLLVMYPWTNSEDGSAAILQGFDLKGNWMSVASTITNQHIRCPGVTIYRGNDGNRLGPFQLGTAGNDPTPLGIGLDDVHTKGVGRLIGKGVEVYDTSAIVTKQGTATCWRQNCNTVDKQVFLYATPTAGPINAYGVTDGVTFFRPPENVGEANQLFGTQTWRGEDGCYIVAVENTEANPAKMPDLTQPVILSDDFKAGNAGVAPQKVISGTFNAQVVGLGNQILTPATRWNFQPYHQGGIFFTGLHKDATYTIRTKDIYERHPTFNETEIVLYTQRAAGYSPKAMEFRTHSFQSVPVGVPVNQNGLGEFFFNLASDVIPEFLKSTHPLLAAAGKAGGALMKYVTGDTKKEPVRAPRPPKPRKGLPQPNQTSNPQPPQTRQPVRAAMDTRTIPRAPIVGQKRRVRKRAKVRKAA
jgi:hypothetical protein